MKFRAIASAAASALAGTIAPQSALAQSEPYIGQIIWTGANFCPRGWARAEGQLLQISNNTALFSILGTTYGGNGQTTFALPDLRGRVTIGRGQGPGLSPRSLGEVSGSETATLTQNQLPAHTHGASSTIVMRANSGAGDSTSPAGNVLAGGGTQRVYSTAAANVSLDATSVNAPTSLDPAGGGQPFNNVQPVLTFTACIALEGIFPPRP